MIRIVHPGSGSLLFTHPGSRGQKATGSRFLIRSTGENNAEDRRLVGDGFGKVDKIRYDVHRGYS